MSGYCRFEEVIACFDFCCHNTLDAVPRADFRGTKEGTWSQMRISPILVRRAVAWPRAEAEEKGKVIGFEIFLRR